MGGPTKAQQQKTILGKTEVMKNNLNPDWQTGIPITYYFERTQHISFKVADSDSTSDKQMIIGEAKITLGEIMGSRN